MEKLAYWLRSHVGEIIGGYRIVRQRARYTLWSVEKVAEGGAA